MFRNSRGSPRRVWAIRTSAAWTPRWLGSDRPSSLSTATTTFDAGRLGRDGGRGPVEPAHSLKESGKDIGATRGVSRWGGSIHPRSRNIDEGHRIPSLLGKLTRRQRNIAGERPGMGGGDAPLRLSD